MTITRFLLPGCVLAACACPALAQPGALGSRYNSVVPSVLPASADEPEYGNLPPPPPPAVARPAYVGLSQMTTPSSPGTPGTLPPDPVGTLTGQPPPPPVDVPAYPPGTYPSPYYVDGPGCCSPLERDGRIGYELYTFSGVDIPFGPGLGARLYTGWDIGASLRTLFFDPTHTAAWTLDLGGSYTHNFGVETHNPANLLIKQQPIVNSTTGTETNQPDLLEFSSIHGVDRSSFNYNLGRDWWLMGRGNEGGEHGTNLRVGVWIGGQYGTAHADVIPLGIPGAYERRQNAFEGITCGGHVTLEKPIGGWILFGGLRAQYVYDWTNIVPPINGNFSSIDIQLQVGIRY
jgi:hypothetical protein